MEDRVFELLEKMYSDMNSRFDKVESRFDKIEGRLDKIEGRLDNVESRLDNVENEVRKNSVKLELIEKKVGIMSEVQKSYIEQNDRQHNEIVVPMKESIDVIELAVKDTSKDMQDLKDKFDKVEKVTIQNTYDIAYFKAAR